MFNLGDGDKEKLEENMEEIKNLVSGDSNNQNQGGQQGNQQAPNNNTQNQATQQGLGQGQNPQQSQEAKNQASEDVQGNRNDLDSGFPGKADTGQQQEVSNQNPAQASHQPQNSQENLSDVEQKVSEMDPRPTGNTEQQTQGLDESLKGLKNEIQRQMEEKQNELEELEEGDYEESDVNASKATRQLSQMSAEGNSLFLEVKKFEKVKNLVREMRNLSHDMGAVMDDLDERTDEAGGTEQEAQSLLNEFAERRDELERAVSDEK